MSAILVFVECPHPQATNMTSSMITRSNTLVFNIARANKAHFRIGLLLLLAFLHVRSLVSRRKISRICGFGVRSRRCYCWSHPQASIRILVLPTPSSPPWSSGMWLAVLSIVHVSASSSSASSPLTSTSAASSWSGGQLGSALCWSACRHLGGHYVSILNCFSLSRAGLSIVK